MTSFRPVSAFLARRALAIRGPNGFAVVDMIESFELAKP
jgi:hypothetical protein